MLWEAEALINSTAFCPLLAMSPPDRILPVANTMFLSGVVQRVDNRFNAVDFHDRVNEWLLPPGRH
jgi:hypothetical protein